MFERARHRIGLRFARWRFRKSRDGIITFTSAVSSAQHVLLIMPLHADDATPTARIVEMLRSTFGDQNITVVTGDYNAEPVRALARSRFLRLFKQQVNGFYIPRADFLNNITERQYDVAIDLNLDLLLPSGYICKASNARVRVGFTQPYADVFYNFQIKPDPTLGRKLIYDRLAQCLQKF